MLALANVRTGPVTEFSSVEAIKQCVIAGMGLAVLPFIVVEQEVRQEKIKILKWAGTSLDIATHVLWHKDKWLSPALSAFLEIVRAQSAESPVAGGKSASQRNARSQPVADVCPI